MSVEIWLLFLLVSIAPVISPGPGILFAITNALRWGTRVTILIGIVNALGITVLALVVGFGLGAVMAASTVAFTILKLIGAGYLIWLGIKIWRDRSAFLVQPGRSGGTAPMWRLSTQALAISLTNPKAALALAALMPPFMDPSLPAVPQVTILAVSYGALCAFNHVLIAYAGGWLRRFLSAPYRAEAVRKATGGLFIGFGAFLATSK